MFIHQTDILSVSKKKGSFPYLKGSDEMKNVP